MAKKKKITLDDFKKQHENTLISPEKLTRSSDQVLPTGSLKVNLMLRGGFRAGTISELYGPEGGGKTTLALSVAKNVLDNGGAVLFLDLERSLDGGTDYDDKHIDGWMEVLGVPPDHPNLVVQRPGSGEEIYKVIEEAILSELFDLIVLDSMAAMVPRSDLEGDIGESAYGKVAKLNSEALKRVLFTYDKQEVEKTHLLVINQARDTVGSSVKGMHSPGGRALRHFVRTKIRCTRVGKNAKESINTIRVRVDKNTFSPPWEEVDIYIHPQFGIDSTAELIEYGVEEGFIEKGGAWYTLTDPETGEELGKEQGLTNMRARLDAMPEFKEKLIKEIWEAGLNKIVNKGEPEDE